MMGLGKGSKIILTFRAVEIFLTFRAVFTLQQPGDTMLLSSLILYNLGRLVSFLCTQHTNTINIYIYIHIYIIIGTRKSLAKCCLPF